MSSEPLKEVYNHAFLVQLMEKITQVYPSFDQAGFLAAVYHTDWETLELKQRMRRITESIGEHLPADYAEAITILLGIAPQCTGFPYLIFPDFVERFGQDHWEISIQALEMFTQGSSAEFAVRPFIKNDPDRMMAQMRQWSKHDNEHVRRLASEGCRPKLPWAAPLTFFREDPSAILPILEQLKADSSKYVQKSVANNLNDIAKDHPDLVQTIVQKWRGKREETDWILRHGSRTLLKQGKPEVLSLFGYLDAEAMVVEDFRLSSEELTLGETLTFSFRVINPTDTVQKLRVEYAIDFVKANGKQSRKIFQLSDKLFAPGETEIIRKQKFVNLTTRKHYAGLHRLTIRINGKDKQSQEFQLTV
ncbi:MULTISPECIES: DNA alkylation repair protein [Gracilibacillus]|uniref:DNA alkylation repair protein n=1 Tax=Gracilibacillus TaxID=74385 RepID=UPI0008255980|nr:MULTISPECIES: DNA alkylation repair protein [Gracilibacillus]